MPAMRWFGRVSALGILLCAGVTTASAQQPLYLQSPQHQAVSKSDGHAFTYADSFQVSQDSQLTRIVWWGGYDDDSIMPAFQTFTVRLFADNADAGGPGTLLATFTVADDEAMHLVSRTPTGEWARPPLPDWELEGMAEYSYKLTLQTPFPLQANTRYWISIVNDMSSAMFWNWEQSTSRDVPAYLPNGPDPSAGWHMDFPFRNFAFRLDSLAPTGTMTTVFEQSPSHLGGLGTLTNLQTEADSFALTQDANIARIVWWGGYGISSAGIPWTDNVTIRIFADDGGQPGAVIATYAAGDNVFRTLTGDVMQQAWPPYYPSVPEFECSVDLPTPVALQANVTYWISIINDPPSGGWNWELAVGGENSSLALSEGDSVSGPWRPFGFDMAFRLLSTSGS